MGREGATTFMGQSEPFEETVTLTGMIGEGPNPSVSLAFPKDDACPDVDPPSLSGTHASNERRIELRMSLPFLNDDDCSELGRIALIVKLERKGSP